MDEVDDATFSHYLRSLPYSDRWTVLQPRLKILFYTHSVEKIAALVKERWGFAEFPRAYTWRFKKWGWKKNIPKQVQTEICMKAMKRASQQKTTLATYKGRPVKAARLRRTMQNLNRQQSDDPLFFDIQTDQAQFMGGYMPFSRNILLNWNLPFGTARSAVNPSPMSQSPGLSGIYDMDIGVATPSSTAASPSAEIVGSENCVSLKSLVREMRASLFMDGKLRELMNTMSASEKRTLSRWLYEFWFFSFVTARNWGKGPLKWTAELLDFETYATTTSKSVIGTPQALTLSASEDEFSQAQLPPNKCRWSIHVTKDHIIEYDITEDEYSLEETHQNDLDCEWTAHDLSVPLSQHLQNALEDNSFSNFVETELPIAVPHMARSVPHSSITMLPESVAFAIMSGNDELLINCLGQVSNTNTNISAIHPFHIAASYLNGGNKCCLILDTLIEDWLNVVGHEKKQAELLVNEAGHTVIDSLFLTILKNHTSIQLRFVDDQVDEQARFAGQEIDICGRWSADSPCFRALIAAGKFTVPSSWKHKFCHTSAQAICHSIVVMSFGAPVLPTLKSGLFQRLCSHCGERLQLSALHALVMVGFCLINAGRPEEDLFGVIACYLALVASGSLPLQRASISIALLLNGQVTDGCEHPKLTPSEFAGMIQDEMPGWHLSEDLHTGWAVFVSLMQVTEKAFEDAEIWREDMMLDEHFPNDVFQLNVYDNVQDAEVDQRIPDDEKSFFPANCTHHCLHNRFSEDLRAPQFGDSKLLGHVWAAVQAELSSYRRIRDNDSWLSPLFSMKKLLKSLGMDETPDLRYIKDCMLQLYCRCGNFGDYAPGTYCLGEIFEASCTNMDGNAETWSRTSYILEIQSRKRGWYEFQDL